MKQDDLNSFKTIKILNLKVLLAVSSSSMKNKPSSIQKVFSLFFFHSCDVQFHLSPCQKAFWRVSNLCLYFDFSPSYIITSRPLLLSFSFFFSFHSVFYGEFIGEWCWNKRKQKKEKHTWCILEHKNKQ